MSPFLSTAERFSFSASSELHLPPLMALLGSMIRVRGWILELDTDFYVKKFIKPKIKIIKIHVMKNEVKKTNT